MALLAVYLTVERTEDQSANTLKIAHLPLSIRQSQLRDLLAPYGETVSINLVTERSKGFIRPSTSATVIFEKSYQADKAHSAIDGKYMGDGWRIKATWGDREFKRTSLTHN
jgi:RNA recognition motif-containing protein